MEFSFKNAARNVARRGPCFLSGTVVGGVLAMASAFYLGSVTAPESNPAPTAPIPISKHAAVTSYHSVDQVTGLCYGTDFSFEGQRPYSRTWEPCTDKVIKQLPPELQQYADRKTGEFCQSSNSTTSNQLLVPNP